MEAILFDFNGTLYNDTQLHVQAWQRYLQERFGMEKSADWIRKEFIGPSNVEIFERLFDGNVTAEQIDRYAREKERCYRKVACSDPKNLKLVDGASELLDWLVVQKIPFALATSSIAENVEFYMKDLGLNRWFTRDRIVCEADGLATKPDPAFYIEAARRIRTTPEKCIVVEDSRAGIAAAVNAHAGKIVAIDNTLPREWLEQNPDVDEVIDNFRDFRRFM